MNLPKDFENYFLRVWKEEDVAALIRGLDAEPVVSIRLNTKRLPTNAEPIGADGHVPWCQEGIYLRERPVFTADPLLHAGAYYVQEASSMFLAHILRSLQGQSTTTNPPSATHNQQPKPLYQQPSIFNIQPSRALDLCAAPGGKSTLLRSLLPDDCLLVSNEPVRARAQVLAENLAKWGHPNVVVTQAFAADISQAVEEGSPLVMGDNTITLSPFDLILADVPCSGEGMMRKEAEAIAQWSPSLVAECAALQRSIIHDIWPALRPGGILIYSTCTFNPEEDEENVEWIARELDAEILPIPIDPTWNIRGDLRKRENKEGEAPSNPIPQTGIPYNPVSQTGIPCNPDSQAGMPCNPVSQAGIPCYPVSQTGIPCYHFLPGEIRGEGFFLAVLRKHASSNNSAPSNSPHELTFLDNSNELTFLDKSNELVLGGFPAENPSPKKKSKKKKNRAPRTPALPVLPTNQLDQDGVPQVELTLADAIRYLQHEALVLPPETPHGIVQVCYRGQRLGLMKNLGTRANNLFPKEWRIRSSFLSPSSLF